MHPVCLGCYCVFIPVILYVLPGTVSYLNIFLAINGVKQRGVLSPIIFTIYIDGLLVKLSRANVGCYVGKFFVGALAIC